MESDADWDEDVRDAFDAKEVYDLIKEIRDPEHPMSLEELGVVSEGIFTFFEYIGILRIIVEHM